MKRQSKRPRAIAASAAIRRRARRRATFGPAIAAALAVTALSSPFPLGCGGEIAPGSVAPREGLPAPGNELAIVRTRRVTRYEAVGTVRSRATATVSSQISGRVVSVALDVGADVEKGTLLCRIDDQEIRARLEQTRSGLRAAEAARDQADTAYARIEKLAAIKAATQEHLEVALSAARQTTANVDTASQRLREAEIALEHARVASPINGVVEQRLVDPGDLALPGKPLFVIHHPEDLRLEAGVREGVIDRIRLGQPVEVELVATRRTVTGTVSEIVPSADPVSRSFLVKVALPPSSGLYPGMFGKLRIPVGVREVILVPSEAVVHVGQLTTVRARMNDRWERRYVSLGEERDAQVEVLAGLAAGDTIGWD